MAYLTTVRAAMRNAVLLSFLAGLAAAPSAWAASAVVKITNQEMFSPKTLTLHAGDTVEWVNSSGAVHTVTDDPALAATPKDAVQKLRDAVDQVIAQPRTQEAFARLGADVIPGTAEDFTRRLRTDYERWVRLRKELGIEVK